MINTANIPFPEPKSKRGKTAAICARLAIWIRRRGRPRPVATADAGVHLVGLLLFPPRLPTKLAQAGWR